jgi:Cu-Zn family superoxide dismutase
VILLAAVAAVAGCGLFTREVAPPVAARAELRDAVGQPVGTATFSETREGLTVVVSVRNLLDGVKAVHIHEVGKCVAPGFESAGAHFNPHGRRHGLRNPMGPHAGDLPNLVVNESGRGTLTFTTSLITLRGRADSILGNEGTSVVVHAEADDETTDPSGRSGGRLACGVIVPGAGGR